jgi:hypothetical protein
MWTVKHGGKSKEISLAGLILGAEVKEVNGGVTKAVCCSSMDGALVNMAKTGRGSNRGLCEAQVNTQNKWRRVTGEEEENHLFTTPM